MGFELDAQQRPHGAGVDREDDATLHALEAAQAVGEAPEVVQGNAQLQLLMPGLEGAKAPAATPSCLS